LSISTRADGGRSSAYSRDSISNRPSTCVICLLLCIGSIYMIWSDLRSGSNGVQIVFPVLHNTLSNIAESILCVRFQVYLGQDGDWETSEPFVETADVPNHAYRTVCHVSPCASPFHDEQQAVHHTRKQPRFSGAEKRRPIDDYAVIVLPRLTYQLRYLFAR